MTFKKEYNKNMDELHIFNCNFLFDCNFISLSRDIVLGFENGDLINIIYFQASENFDLDRNSLSKISQINLKLNITSDILILNCELVITTSIRSILKSVNVNKANNYGLSDIYEEIVI